MLEFKFKPESEIFESATKEYQDMWAKEGKSIISAFETVTGLRLKQKSIEAIIYEGPSFSGNLKLPMKLRASSSYEVKKGTLVHELGHRLIAPMHNRIEGVDEHRILNLFLYDVLVHLYGKDFADMEVSVESKRKGLYDYEGAWNWFLKLSREERSSIWNEFLSLNVDRARSN